MLGRGFRKTITTATVRRHFAADAKIVEKRTSANYRYREVDVVGAENPTYLKEKGDNVIALAAGAGLLFGVFNIAGGLYKMSFGIKD